MISYRVRCGVVLTLLGSAALPTRALSGQITYLAVASGNAGHMLRAAYRNGRLVSVEVSASVLGRGVMLEGLSMRGQPVRVRVDSINADTNRLILNSTLQSTARFHPIRLRCYTTVSLSFRAKLWLHNSVRIPPPETPSIVDTLTSTSDGFRPTVRTGLRAPCSCGPAVRLRAMSAQSPSRSTLLWSGSFTTPPTPYGSVRSAIFQAKIKRSATGSGARKPFASRNAPESFSYGGKPSPQLEIQEGLSFSSSTPAMVHSLSRLSGTQNGAPTATSCRFVHTSSSRLAMILESSFSPNEVGRGKTILVDGLFSRPAMVASWGRAIEKAASA